MFASVHTAESWLNMKDNSADSAETILQRKWTGPVKMVQ